MANACSNCFYVATGPMGNLRCHRHQPAGSPSSEAIWPVVHPDDWCGDGYDATANAWYAPSGTAAGSYLTTGDQSLANATLVDVIGMMGNLAAGQSYWWVVTLYFTSAGGGASGGLQVAMSGTVVPSSIIYDGWQVDANAIAGQSLATALNTVVANNASRGTNAVAIVHGTVVVNTTGTLKVQAAQSNANATASVVKAGSLFQIRQVT